MTSISQWLAAEKPDRTEPASFYVPGARYWGDPEAPKRYPADRAGLPAALEWVETEEDEPEGEEGT